MAWASAVRIKLSEAERIELEARSRRRKISRADAMRSEIIFVGGIFGRSMVQSGLARFQIVAVRLGRSSLIAGDRLLIPLQSCAWPVWCNDVTVDNLCRFGKHWARPVDEFQPMCGWRHRQQMAR